MAAKARLKDIVDELEMQFDEYLSFLNRDTGEVASVSRELLSAAEEDSEEAPDLPKWQEPEWELAKQIVSTDSFLRLPTKYDIHEWEIMEDFTNSAVMPSKIREELQYAIHGAGAFRHFKATVRRHDIEEAWFAFRTESLREIAIDWCEEHEIAWE